LYSIWLAWLNESRPLQATTTSWILDFFQGK